MMILRSAAKYTIYVIWTRVVEQSQYLFLRQWNQMDISEAEVPVATRCTSNIPTNKHGNPCVDRYTDRRISRSEDCLKIGLRNLLDAQAVI